MHKIRQTLLLGMGALCLLSVPPKSMAGTVSDVLQPSSVINFSTDTSASEAAATGTQGTRKAAAKSTVSAIRAAGHRMSDDTMHLPHNWRTEVSMARTVNQPAPHRHTQMAAVGPSVYISGMPVSLIPIYKAAGARFGIPWSVLAAIHKTETDFAVTNSPVSSEGAMGPMQFMPATFARYGVAAPGHQGRANIHNVSDAIYTAANMLAQDGYARNPAAAIYAYNHSMGYVRQVLRLAQVAA